LGDKNAEGEEPVYVVDGGSADPKKQNFCKNSGGALFNPVPLPPGLVRLEGWSYMDGESNGDACVCAGEVSELSLPPPTVNFA
jgi:hypothetical protein